MILCREIMCCHYSFFLIKVSSAKEMCLALMEQFEILYNIKKFIVLLPLQKDGKSKICSLLLLKLFFSVTKNVKSCNSIEGSLRVC